MLTHDIASHHYRLESRPHLEFRLMGGGLSGRWQLGTLVFACPATGEEVSTGIEMDLVTLEQLELSKIYCPHCRQPHQMAEIEYWLETHQAEPQDEAAKAA
jgi:hypothetical protein